MMAKARKRQFPRLALYAVSPGELRNLLDKFGALGAHVYALEELVKQLRLQVERLTEVQGPARVRGRRGVGAPEVLASAAAQVQPGIGGEG